MTASQTSTATSFLDLPGELRNEIYGYLLPDRLSFDPGTALRHDGTKASTSFMAACRQVYNESRDIMYGGKTFHLYVDGCVQFLGQYIEFEQLHTTSFAILNQIETLNLHIDIGDCDRELCELQDTLFFVLAFLHSHNKMHAFNVSITVVTALDPDWFANDPKGTADDPHGSADDSDWWHRLSMARKRDEHKISIMKEFQEISPGDISRPHRAAFLTDPLRTIRGLFNGKKKCKFTLDFIGKSGQPWRRIKGQVSDLIKGDSPVPDYRIFSRYYEPLEALHVFAKSCGIWMYVRAYMLLAEHRARGIVDLFRAEHERFVTYFRQEMREKVENRLLTAFDEVEGLHLLHDLETNLPAEDADTSFFGYSLADAALREWQDTGRAEAKAAKEKRKREREAKGETKSRKKARVL